MRQTDLQKQLIKIVGEGAEFRGLQKAGMEAIIARVARVLIIMRTGGGKSLFFMLPASSSRDGVTVVIVPLNSLREDLKGRCDRVGISCAEWDGKRPSYWASIVLVTPESAVTKAFSRFIDEKRMMKQLDRIVIDECHVVLDSTSEWRPQVRQLTEMTEKGTQVVYLTATLPPKDEVEFFQAMGLREEEVQVFRDRTTRKNVAYSIRDYDGEREDEEVWQLVEQKKREYPLPGQIVIYCKTVSQSERLARVLGCRTYHRTVGSEDEKRKILRRLTEGREQVFTATNALGLGIDAPTIRVVVHVGIKEKMRDYAQESGRVGRDGLRSEAIMMRRVWTDREGKQKVEKGWRAEQGMKDFLEGKQCRRVVLDREMDGRADRGGCEVGEERCDVCRRRPRGEKRRRMVTESERADEERGVRESEESRVEVNRIGSGFGVDRTGSGFGIVGTGSGFGVDGTGSGFGIVGTGLGFGIDGTGSGFEVVDSRLENRGKEWEERRAEEEQKRREAEENDRLRQEWEEEIRGQEMIRWRRIEERSRAGRETEELERFLDEWQGVCVICKATGRQAEDHTDWKECRVDEGDRRMMEEGVERIKEEVIFERFSGCQFCKMPQKVCHLWEEYRVGGRMRFSRRRGGSCQYRGEGRGGLLIEVVIGLLSFRFGEREEEWLEGEQEKVVGFKRQTEGMDEWERLKRWMGKKVVVNGIEMSEMCRMVMMMGV